MKRIFILLLFSQILSGCAMKKYFEKDHAASKDSVSAPKPTSKPFSEELDVAADFVQGSEDVPLLLGMERASDYAMGFDSAVGSISSSSYVSAIELKEVCDFYVRTLPQMGWALVQSDYKKSIFKRDDEKLEIEFTARDGQQLVNFFLSSSL